MRSLLCVLLCFVVGTLLHAEPSEKSLRYHQLLVKKPQPGTVLDRFVDAWLETESAPALLDFLKGKTTAANATANDHLLLALYLAQQATDDAAALAAFEQAVKLVPENAIAWQQKARLEARMLDFPRALASLDAALAQHPEPKLALDLAKQRGRTLLRLGRTKEALDAWAALQKEQGNDEDLADELVDLQVEEGLDAEAVTQLTELIAKTKDPYNQATRRLRLGDLQLRLVKKKEALDAYAAALTQAAAGSWIEGEAMSRIELSFRREDNLKGLAEHLDALVKANPQRLGLMKTRAQVMAELGDKDGALAVYQDILQRSPGQRDLRESYLDLLEKFERYAEAITQTKLLIEQNKTDKELQLRLATLHDKAKDKPASAAALDAFLAMPGTDEFDHLRVANMLDQWKRLEEAKQRFATAIAKYPKSFEVRDAHAQFLHRNGEKEAALKVWSELAQGVGRDELLAIAMGLIARQEHQTAFDLLSKRVTEFGHEPQFLAPLCQAALAVKQAKAAVPWTLARVQLSDESNGLPDALKQAETVLHDADAIETTLKDLKARPSPSASDLCLMSTLLESLGDLQGAENALKNPKSDQSVALQTQLIRLFQGRQEFAKAAEVIAQLLATTDGKTAQNAQRRVDLLNRGGDTEAAIKAIDLWKQLAPSAAQPFLMESQLLRNLGRTEEALAVLRTAQRKFDDDEGVSAALADTYAEAGQYVQTERIYLKLYEQANDATAKLRWVKSLSDAAMLRAEMKRLTEVFVERQKNNRADPVPWLALATIYNAAEKNSDELEALQQAWRLRPTDVQLAHRIARLQDQMGKWQDGMKTLEAAAKSDTTDRTRTLMALTLLTNGETDKAYAIFAQVAGAESMDPRDAEMIADTMASNGEWDKMVTFLTPLTAKHPGDYRIGYQLAVAIEESGDQKKALNEFMRVIAIRDELPGFPKNAKAQASRNEWLKSYDSKSYPPGTRDYYAAANSHWQAYLYRHNRGNRTSTRGGFLTLADDVSTSRDQAAGHLMTLAGSLSREEREALEQPLKAMNFGGWPMVCYAENNERYGSATLPDDILKRFPDDVLLNAIWSPDLPSSDAGALPLLRHSYEVLKKDYPGLAFSRAMTALTVDPKEGGALFDEALKLEGRMDKNQRRENHQAWWVLGAKQNLNGDGNEETYGKDLPESRKAQLQELMLKAHRETPADLARCDSFFWITHTLIVRKQWQLFIDVVQQEIKDYQGNDKVLKAPNYYSTARQTPQRGAAFQPLAFPPADTYAPHIVCALAYPDPYNTSNYGFMKPLEDAKDMLPLVDKVADPKLRMYLRWFAGDSAGAEKEADALVAKPDAKLSNLLMAAALADRLEKKSRAMELLTRASSLPMTSTEREPVDKALLNAITDEKTLPPATQEVAKLAVRRLKSQTSIPKESIADLMEKLAMTDEAKRLRQLATASPSTVSRSGGYVNPRNSRTTVDKLIAAGNMEGAARELLNGELANYQRYYFQNNMSYAVRSGIRSLNSSQQQLIPHVVKYLESRKGDSITKRLDFSVWMDILGQKGKALAEFKSIVEQDPKQDLARARLIGLTMDADAAAGIALLEAAPPERWASLLQNGLWETMRSLQKIEPRSQLITTFARLLDRLAKEGKALPKDSAGVLTALPELARQSSGDGPPRYDMDDERGANGKEDALAVKTRLNAHEALCDAMLKHPALSSSAFASLTLTRKPEELLPLARTVLQAMSESALKPTPFVQRMNTNYSNDDRKIWLPSPAAYLVRDAMRRGDAAVVENDLMPLITKALPAPKVKAMRNYFALWQCGEPDFAKAAMDYLKVADDGDYQWWQGAEPSVPMSILQERKLTMNLDAFIAQVMEEKSNWSPPALVGQYVRHLASTASEQRVNDFIQIMGRKVMGKPEGWAKKVEIFAQGYWGGGRNNDKGSYSVHELIQNLLRAPETMGVGLRIADAMGFSQNGLWRSNITGYMELDEMRSSPKAVLETLRSTAFLKPAKEFDAWDTQGGRTMLSNILDTTPAVNDTLKAVGVELAKVQPRTFGLDLCTAICAGDGNREKALTAFIAQHGAEFNEVPEKQRNGLIIVLKKFYPPLKTPGTMNAATTKLLEPLLGAELKLLANRADAILAAKSYKDVITSGNDVEFYESVYRLLGDLAKTNPDKAKAVFTKAAELIEAKVSSVGWDGSSCIGGWTHRSALMGEVLRENKGIEACAFAHRMFVEDTSGMLIQGAGSNSVNWGQAMNDSFKNNGGLGNVGRGLKTMLTRLSTLMNGATSEPMSRAFIEFVIKMPPSLRIPALKWCAKNEHPFAVDLDAAIRIYLLSDPPSAKNAALMKQLDELGGAAVMWKRYTDIVLNTKLSAQVRLSVATDVLFRRWHDAPPELVRTAASLIAQENKAMHACSGFTQCRYILRAFCELPLDDQWRAAADEQWEAWLLRNAKNGESTRFGRAYHPNDENAGQMLRVFARHGDAERMERIIRDTQNSQTNEPSAFASLVAAGAHERARTWLEQWGMGFLYKFNDELMWTPLIAEQTQKFVASCPKADVALFGEIILNGLKDEPIAQPGMKGRKDRMMALVPKFLATKFESADMRQRCLELLCDEDKLTETPELRAELERSLKELEPSALAALDDTWKSFRTVGPAAGALAMQVIEDGNTQTALDLLPKMLAMPDSIRYSDKSHVRRWTLGYVFGPILYRAEERLLSDKPLKRDALLKMCDMLARKLPDGRDTSSCDTVAARAVGMLMIDHARTGGLGGFEAWRKTLTSEELTKVKKQFASDRTAVWILLMNAFGKPKQFVSLEDRTKLVSTLLTNDWVADLFPTKGTNVPNLCATLVTGQKLFKPEEFAPIAKSLAKQLPRDGRTAGEAAELLTAHGKLPESNELYQMAIGSATDPGIKVVYQFRLADNLERFYKKPEAIAVLKTVAKDKIGPQQQKTLESMLKRLGSG